MSAESPEATTCTRSALLRPRLLRSPSPPTPSTLSSQPPTPQTRPAHGLDLLQDNPHRPKPRTITPNDTRAPASPALVQPTATLTPHALSSRGSASVWHSPSPFRAEQYTSSNGHSRSLSQVPPDRTNGAKQKHSCYRGKAWQLNKSETTLMHTHRLEGGGVYQGRNCGSFRPSHHHHAFCNRGKQPRGTSFLLQIAGGEGGEEPACEFTG